MDTYIPLGFKAKTIEHITFSHCVLNLDGEHVDTIAHVHFERDDDKEKSYSIRLDLEEKKFLDPLVEQPTQEQVEIIGKVAKEICKMMRETYRHLSFQGTSVTVRKQKDKQKKLH